MQYFFKVFLNDAYIKSNRLEEHEVDQTTYKDYISYQKLIGIKDKDSNYLAKNNNLILRYRSLRAHNSDFKIVLFTVFKQLRHSCHGAVVAYDFADDTGRFQPGQSLGLRREVGVVVLLPRRLHLRLSY